MDWQDTPYVLPLFVAAVASAALVLFIWQRRPAPGARPAAALLFAAERESLLAAEHEQRLLAETLTEVTLALTAHTNFEDVLDEILYQAQRLVPYAAANIMLLEADTLRSVRWQGYDVYGGEELVANLRQPLNAFAADAEAVELGRPVVISDTSQDPRWVVLDETAWIRSDLIVPIRLHDRVLGLLRLDSDAPNGFSTRDAERLLPLSSAAAIALENARLFVEVEQRAAVLSTLLKAARVASSTLRLEEVIALIARQMIEATGVDGCSLSRWDRGADAVITWIELRRLPGEQPDEPGTAYALNGFPATRAVLETGQPMSILTSDPRADPAEVALMRKKGFEALLMLPLAAGERVIGLVELDQTRRQRHFTTDEIRLCQALADQAAIAIENARLYAAEQVRREELSTLYGLSRQLAATGDMETMMDVVARHSVQAVHVTFCRVVTLEDDGSFMCRAAHPIRLLEFDLGVGEPDPEPAWRHYRHVLTQAAPFVLLRDDPLFDEAEREALFLHLTQSLCLAPLRLGDTSGGLLILGEARSPAREPLDADKLRLVAAIADQAASALHRARLHEALETAYLQTILALANAMDARDAYTADHSERLAEWAVITGRRLGCRREELETLRWAALLHDIGKIGIPDHILLKPGPLDDDERAVIRNHPEIGEQIVAPVTKLATVVPIIRAHQEHWDGSGYPDGLKGDSIPREARILAVVDAYGAMTDDRVYRTALNHEEAVAELRAGSGTQFDPRVVRAFLRTIGETEETE